MVNILRAKMSKMEITTPRILPRFPTTSEMFSLKMMRQWSYLAYSSIIDFVKNNPSGELRAVIARLMSKYLGNGWKW